MDGVECRSRVRCTGDLQRFGFADDGVVTIAWIRMIAQKLGTAISALLLDRPEHVGHLPWLVAGACHDLRAEQVRLAFVFAAVLQKVSAEAELRPLRDDRALRPADNRSDDLAGQRAELEFLRLGRLQRAM